MLKRLHIFLRRIAFGANIVAVIGLLIAYAAPYVSPSRMWIVAFFGLGYPFLLLANIIFACAWLLRRNPRAALSLLAIVIGWSNLTGIFTFHRNSELPEHPLRVMTFNVRYFDALRNSKNEAQKYAVQDAMLKSIAEVNPDILCGQDFSGDNAETTARALAFLKKPELLPYRYYENSSGIFSKFPIVVQGGERFDGSYNSYHFADIKINSKTIRVYNLHLQSNKLGYTEKILDAETLKNIKADETQAFYRGIFGKLYRGYCKREQQALLVKQQLDASPYPYIVCGDFNDTPISYAYNVIAKGLKDSFRECGNGMGSTYAGPLPALRIDYILTSPLFKIYSHRILRRDFSDHYAVVSELSL